MTSKSFALSFASFVSKLKDRLEKKTHEMILCSRCSRQIVEGNLDTAHHRIHLNVDHAINMRQCLFPSECDEDTSGGMRIYQQSFHEHLKTETA